MTFDPNRPVQIRDGRPARILCTDLKSDQPIAAIVTQKDRTETVDQFSLDGRWFGDDCPDRDLINVPENRTLWVNIYTGSAEACRSRDDADTIATRDRIACVPLTYTVGEGL